MATNKDSVSSAFKGIRYIRVLLALLESMWREDNTKLIFSPKFIYRGESKIFQKSIKTSDEDFSLFMEKYPNIPRNKLEEYDYFQNYAIRRFEKLEDFFSRSNENTTCKDFVLKSFLSSYNALKFYIENKCINDERYIPQFYNLLCPKEISSGASIRLRTNKSNNKKKNSKPLSVAAYLHYIRTLINDIKASYPSFSQMNDLDVLADIQHKGGASCLVDFSNNILMSLWFATQTENNSFGYLYCYDVHRDAFQKDNISKINEKHQNLPIEDLLLSTKKTTSFVRQKAYKFWMWKPSNINTRIARQESVFVFGLEKFLVKEHGVYILPIPPGWKRPIQTALKAFFGITAETIFPDSDGFATSHSKTNILLDPTNYVNPQFLNSSYSHVEDFQKGLSALFNGEYSLALKLLANFESANKDNIHNYTLSKSVGTRKLEKGAVLLELMYSLAMCYHKLNMYYVATKYFQESLIILDLLWEIIIPERLTDSVKFDSMHQYIENKMLKISNDYINNCLKTGNFKDAQEIIKRIHQYGIVDNNGLLDVLNEEFRLLSVLSGEFPCDKTSFEDEYIEKHPTLTALHLYFEIVDWLINNYNDNQTLKLSTELKRIEDRFKSSLNEVSNCCEPLFLSFHFGDFRDAYNRHFKGYKVILKYLDNITNLLESTFKIAQSLNVLEPKD